MPCLIRSRQLAEHYPCPPLRLAAEPTLEICLHAATCVDGRDRTPMSRTGAARAATGLGLEEMGNRFSTAVQDYEIIPLPGQRVTRTSGPRHAELRGAPQADRNRGTVREDAKARSASADAAVHATNRRAGCPPVTSTTSRRRRLSCRGSSSVSSRSMSPPSLECRLKLSAAVLDPEDIALHLHGARVPPGTTSRGDLGPADNPRRAVLARVMPPLASLEQLASRSGTRGEDSLSAIKGLT